jgi:Predicted esterase
METPPPQPADVTGPHHEAAIYRAGLDPAAADVTLVLVHGRGARAGGMVQFALQQVETPVAMVAPEAVGWEWYPESFLAPREANEPSLSSAIAVVDAAIDLAQAAGAAPGSIVGVGFSQGACLVAETVLRRGERLGGAVMLSGGLIGAPERSFSTDADLAGMPAFVGVSDDDPHIPSRGRPRPQRRSRPPVRTSASMRTRGWATPSSTRRWRTSTRWSMRRPCGSHESEFLCPARVSVTQ